METQIIETELERLEANYWKVQDEFTRLLEAIEEAQKKTQQRLRIEQMLRELAEQKRIELQLWWMGGDGDELD